MTEAHDSIESLRETFERIEPSEASRARWVTQLQRTECALDQPARGEPFAWRLIAGGGLAAAAALALVVALSPETEHWSVSDSGRPFARSIWSMGDVAVERIDSARLVAAVPPTMEPSPYVFMNDESLRQLLEWQLPSFGGLDLGIDRMWNEVSSAILRPITRLGAQLEAGV